MARRSHWGMICLAIIATVLLQLGSGAYAADKKSKAKNLVDQAQIRAGMPPRVVHAERKLFDCLDRVVERFADQQETAQAVADAALVLCEPQEDEYLVSRGDVLDIQHLEWVKDALRPEVAARVMTVRVERAKRR